MKLRMTPHINSVKVSATLAINMEVRNLRAHGKHVAHLGFGQSPFDVPKPMQERLIENTHDNHYADGAGLRQLREAISNYFYDEYQLSYDADGIFIAPGSKESLYHLLMLVEGPLLLPAPSWVSYEPQARLLGKDVYRIQTNFDDRYLLNGAALEKFCSTLDREQQKILLLNSPNNPTGMMYDAKTLAELAVVCRAHNIIVISDEIYASIQFNKTGHTSMFHHYPEGTIVTSGISKLHSSGGYRLGFSMIPAVMRDLRKALKVLISETYSCVATPIQHAALEAYENSSNIKPYLNQCIERHQWAGSYLSGALKAIGFRLHEPQGAFYLMPDLSSFDKTLNAMGIFDDVALCRHLLQNYQVACLPGSDFGVEPSMFAMRIATVDYDGNAALKACSIDDECFSNLKFAVERLSSFMKHIKVQTANFELA